MAFRRPSIINSGRWYNAIAQYPLRRQEVSFRNQPVGDQGAVQIANALLHVPRLGLRVLDLGHTSIGDEGASALGHALSRTTAPLHTLRLDGNDIGDNGAAALANGLALNATISKMGLRNNHAITNDFHMRIQDILLDPSRYRRQLGTVVDDGEPIQVSPPDQYHVASATTVALAEITTTSATKNIAAPEYDRLSVPTMASMQTIDLAQGLKFGRVFLSHTGQDRPAKSFSAHLWEALISKEDLEVFYDEHSLEPGTVWKPTIKEFALNCDVFLCIYSESYWERFWCMFELDLALRSGRIILPVWPFVGSPTSTHSMAFAPFMAISQTTHPSEPKCT
jgi:TIR domain/Leucine Rich repeat